VTVPVLNMSYLRLEKLKESPSTKQKILIATDKTNGYWQITRDSDKQSPWGLVLAVNQMDIKPVSLRTSRGVLFIGVEQAVFCVTENTGEIISSITDLTFLQSIEMLLKERVLVAAEDEMLLFTESGVLKWRVNLPDVIQDVKEIADKLQIELDSGEKLFVITETGLVSNEEI